MPDEQSYLSYFTPSQMSHEMLEAILVKRQSLAARLVERIKQSVLTEAKYQNLLLGPRGMGKSYLVALIYHRVKELPQLKDKIAIAYFAEEEWSVTSLTDLFLVILKALEREYGGLQTRIDALYRLPIREIESAAGELIREFAGDRTLLILMENLDEIFRGLGKEGQWAFRSYLSERPFVTILATTPSLFAGIEDRDAAFHGFFNPIYLEELTVDEATELLEKVAERRKDQPLADFLKTPTAKERVQAVHDLAGGHPRIYLLFAHLLTQETLDELVTPFLQLLDELTPYYQSRMQLLSPQQRKIIEFLCGVRGATTVKEIAVQNLMTPQTASSQLYALEEMAYVRKTQVGRESWYELREPLLRLVIEVKRGRTEPVRLIVDFLRRWYSRLERQERLALASPNHPLTREYLLAALDLERAIQDKPDWERAERLFAKCTKCLEAEDFNGACEIAAEIIESKGKVSDAVDWFLYAYFLEKTQQYTSAFSAWDKIVDLAPENVSAWCFRGILAGLLCEYSIAKDSFGRALNIDPNNFEIWNLRGMALYYLSDYATSMTDFSKSIELNPLKNSAWFNRAELYILEGQWDKFFEDIEHGFSSMPTRSTWFGGANEYCSHMLRRTDFAGKIPQFVHIYANYNALSVLGQELTRSITAVWHEQISHSVADEWLAAWKSVSHEYEVLEISVQILAAAVEWKKTKSVRALLALPVEERRILESLLPKPEGEETAQ